MSILSEIWAAPKSPNAEEKRQFAKAKFKVSRAGAGDAILQHVDPLLDMDYYHKEHRGWANLSEEAQMHFADQETAYDQHTLLVVLGMAYVLHREPHTRHKDQDSPRECYRSLHTDPRVQAK